MFNLKRIVALSVALAITPQAYAQFNKNKEKDEEKTALPLKSQSGKQNFSEAHPEDITNDNYPQLIESFDYPNADITEIVKAISKLTGKRFIIDPSVRGKITIIAPSQITVAEAYRAFLSALAMNNYTIVPSGKFLKIRSIRNARQDSIETYSGNYFPNTDQLITRIIKLKYINAEEVHKQLRLLTSKDGDATPYSPTNSLIITDFGSNIERIMNIINQLDVPGFEEKLVVIRIKHARAKDISELIDQIINGGKSSSKSRFGSSVPRFRSSSNRNSSSSRGSGAANYSQVIPDGRTNSIIVVGNVAGIARIRNLVKKLDFKLRPEDAGGVYVYYLRHNESEKVANVLNGIASESTKSKSGSSTNSGKGNPTTAQPQAVFGGDVKVTSDKENNSLIITASKQDFEVVKTILKKIDIPRDQVFVKAVIMEMYASNTISWGVDYYTFADGTNGAGRVGFRSSKNIAGLLDPSSDSGAILGFGSGKTVSINVGGAATEVPSLTGLIRFLKSNAGGNILSTPQLTALDNEEAELEVGENVPVSQENASTGTTVTSGVKREDLTIKLKITPFISPDTDSVRMKIEQDVKQLSDTPVKAAELAKISVATSKRRIKTAIVVNSGDTAVLGGLMSDEETENISKIPVLGDIPILGWLFKGKRKQKIKKNLMVFITPQIIRNTQDSSDLLNEKLNERIDFIQQHMQGRDPHGQTIDKLPRKAFLENGNDQFISNPELPQNEVQEEKEEPATESF